MNSPLYQFTNPYYMPERMFLVKLIVPVTGAAEAAKFAKNLKSFTRVEINSMGSALEFYAVDIIFGDMKDVAWFQLKYSNSVVKEMFL